LNELRERHFDPYKDLLICVGDLIDRGPDSLQCLQLLKRPWFKTVRETMSRWLSTRLTRGDDSLVIQWRRLVQ
jgi:serine/threonine protein phosphatase 1